VECTLWCFLHLVHPFHFCLELHFEWAPLGLIYLLIWLIFLSDVDKEPWSFGFGEKLYLNFEYLDNGVAFDGSKLRLSKIGLNFLVALTTFLRIVGELNEILLSKSYCKISQTVINIHLLFDLNYVWTFYRYSCYLWTILVKFSKTYIT
jgi:hypothetical protein